MQLSLISYIYNPFARRQHSKSAPYRPMVTFTAFTDSKATLVAVAKQDIKHCYAIVSLYQTWIERCHQFCVYNFVRHCGPGIAYISSNVRVDITQQLSVQYNSRSVSKHSYNGWIVRLYNEFRESRGEWGSEDTVTSAVIGSFNPALLKASQV